MVVDNKGPSILHGFLSRRLCVNKGIGLIGLNDKLKYLKSQEQVLKDRVIRSVQSKSPCSLIIKIE